MAAIDNTEPRDERVTHGARRAIHNQNSGARDGPSCAPEASANATVNGRREARREEDSQDWMDARPT